MRIEAHPDANQEAAEAAAWLEQNRQGYGAELRDAVTAVIDLIIRHAEIGPRVSRRARKKRILGFRYYVVYQLLDDVFYIVAIAHQSRRPRYWRSRLRK